MKKLYWTFFALFPLLLHAEVIVTISNGNIENVSDIDTTESVIYFIHDFTTKSIKKSSVVAIIDDEGHYITISHIPEDESSNKTDNFSPLNQHSEYAWVDLQVGVLHTFPDGSQGVIFFVNNEGHGLAVSLQEENRVWDTNRGRNMQDIPEIPNSESARPFINQIGEGEINTAAILRHLSSYECPAASWCTSLGEGWYLPTASELLYLLKIANEGRGEDGPISRALSTNGGIEIDESWYWTSSESERTEAINISKRGSIATEDKDDTNAVRAVRAF